MARSIGSLTLLLLAGLGSAVAWAAESTPAPATPQPDKSAAKAARQEANRERKVFDGTPSPEMENVRRAIEALTPEQKKHFQENFLRWANLTPEEKKALRDREDFRKKVIEQEVQAALQDTGLQLDDTRRAEFAKRYSEERKKIEEQLRREMMEKRKPLVHELLGRLKEEFSNPAPATTETPVAPAGETTIQTKQ